MTYRRLSGMSNRQLLIGGLLLLIVIIAGIGYARPAPTRPKLTQEQQGVVALATFCVENGNVCVGGFVETVSGYVLRIETRRISGAATHERALSLTTLESWRPEMEIAAKALKAVITPNHPDWNAYAVRHAQQFVLVK